MRTCSDTHPSFRLPLSLVLGLILLCGIWGCGGYYDDDGSLDSLGDSPAIEEIRDLYEREKYGEAVVKLKEFIKLSPGSRFLDEANFLLARSQYEEDDYVDAEDRFRRLMRDFPNSSYSEDAAYYLPLSILSQSRKAELDQTETLAAKAQFRSFLLRYPESEYAERAREHVKSIDERLARKDFLNGETYRKMKRYRSAVFYYEKVQEEWPESPYYEESMFRLAEVAKKRSRWEDALLWANKYLADHPEGAFADKMRRIKEKSLERGAGGEHQSPEFSGDGG